MGQSRGRVPAVGTIALAYFGGLADTQMQPVEALRQPTHCSPKFPSGGFFACCWKSVMLRKAKLSMTSQNNTTYIVFRLAFLQTNLKSGNKPEKIPLRRSLRVSCFRLAARSLPLASAKNEKARHLAHRPLGAFLRKASSSSLKAFLGILWPCDFQGLRDKSTWAASGSCAEPARASGARGSATRSARRSSGAIFWARCSICKVSL